MRTMGLENERREYRHGRLDRESLRDHPVAQLRHWLDQAIASGLVADPTAMCVATVDAAGRPWQRMVLLKQLDDRGLVFYTNLGSRKARDIAANPRVSLHFPWNAMDRQAIVGGTARRLGAADVLKYFISRPRESQLAAWSSRQSSRVNSRQALGPVHADARQIPPRGGSPAGLLGRLPGRAGRIRILAGGRAPPPRPFPVPAAGGWRLGDRAAGALRRVVHVTSYKLHVTRYTWGREATPSLRLETEVRWFGAVGRHAPCVQPATCHLQRET